MFTWWMFLLWSVKQVSWFERKIKFGLQGPERQRDNYAFIMLILLIPAFCI